MLIHAVLERFVPVDEHNRDLVIKLAAELFVGVHINFAPLEAAAAMEFDEALLHHLA